MGMIFQGLQHTIFLLVFFPLLTPHNLLLLKLCFCDSKLIMCLKLENVLFPLVQLQRCGCDKREPAYRKIYAEVAKLR